MNRADWCLCACEPRRSCVKVKYQYQNEALYDTWRGRICCERFEAAMYRPLPLVLASASWVLSPESKMEIALQSDAGNPRRSQRTPSSRCASSARGRRCLSENSRKTNSKTHANAGLERLRDFMRINLVRLILSVERVVQFLCRGSAAELLG